MSGSSSSTRLKTLAHAEWLQLKRNPTLMSVIPVPIAIVAFLVYVVDTSTAGVAVASDAFILMALVFFVFYSSLSMSTTRRDEKVLKRLRTGEAYDWEILTAIVIPIALLTIVQPLVAVPLAGYLNVDDVPWVNNATLMAITITLGIVLSHGLALLTSYFTRNTEAAMITSTPVMLLAVISQIGLRSAYPQWLENVVQWTPYALINDLFRHGWIGGTDMILERLAVLLLLTLVLTWAGYRFIRWETYR
ncbi:ABC transporter permease [Corynebacterium cystitidis]|uniref:ABC transporter permease n=1 Tax=Corynebacterium cystitidis TaxID=35757 RepID=UPI00211E33A9|nr:ABC transporter permease [Corynebacterium cystitidis]